MPRVAPLLPILATLGAMASLAVGTSLAKSIFPALGPAGVTLLRVVTAALLLLLVWRPWRRRISRGDVGVLIAYGVSIGVMNLLFYEAVARIPFGVAVAFEFCGPLLVAVFTSRRAIDFLWVALAMAGLALLLPIGAEATPAIATTQPTSAPTTAPIPSASDHLDPVGVAFALGAGACWAIYILIGSTVGRRLHGGQVTSVGMAVAAVVVMPFGVASGGAALLEPWALLIGAGVGLMSGAIPFTLELYAMSRMPRRTFSILLSMEPALAAVAGLFMLDERLTAWQTIAIACVVAASVGSAASARRDAPASDDPPPIGVD